MQDPDTQFGVPLQLGLAPLVFIAKEIGSGSMARATHVIKRFPEHELAIERLVRQSESFRSMCDDYAVGIEALRRWERATDPRSAARIAELRESLAELEQELLEELKQEAASRSGQRRRADRP